MKTKFSLFLILLVIFAGFLFFRNGNQPLKIAENVLAQTSCTMNPWGDGTCNCSEAGTQRCDGSRVYSCGYKSSTECCWNFLYYSESYGCALGSFRCGLSGQTNSTDSYKCVDRGNNCYTWQYWQDCSQRSSVCGGETCQVNQKPVWTCSGNQGCTFTCQVNPSCCTNACSFIGQTECFSDIPIQKRTCQKSFTTNCLEWGLATSCSGNTSCGYGTCLDNQKPVWNCFNGSCIYSCEIDDLACGKDDCPRAGATQCSDSQTKQTCGQYDGDPYLDWKTETCSGDTSCGFGTCQDNQKPVWGCLNGACNYTCVNEATCCTNECSQQGQTQCKDTNTKQICGNWDVADVCLEWSSGESCVSNSSCGFGKCQEQEKPVWKCASQGVCDYTCVSDSSCRVARNCTDDCSSAGTSQCADSTHVKICGYYDTDVCLDWPTSPKICSGSTVCGTGICQPSQRPQWRCSNGRCDFICIDDSGCGTSPSPSPSPSSTCQDECLQRGQTQCLDDVNVKVCDSNFDSDTCLKWGAPRPCEGETTCGSQGCQSNQRPSWSCSNDQCAFRCVDDAGCQQSQVPALCGDLICDEGESTACPQDCEKPSFTISAATKKEKGTDWKKETSYQARERFDVRVVVKNNSQRDFAQVALRAEIPQEIIYEKNLKIDDSASRVDIRYGLDLGFFPANAEKIITFKVSASSKIKEKTEEELKVFLEAENLSATDVLKIIIEKPSTGAKWYVWLLAILIIGSIVGGFLVLRARAQSQL